MTQSQKNAEHRREIWSDTITSWKQSGLSQRAYCEQHQLALGTFAYWRGRLKKLDAGASLVQIYSGLIYHGPKLISDIVKTIEKMSVKLSYNEHTSV